MVRKTAPKTPRKTARKKPAKRPASKRTLISFVALHEELYSLLQQLESAELSERVAGIKASIVELQEATDCGATMVIEV